MANHASWLDYCYTIKCVVPGGDMPWKCQFNQIQNDQLEAIIDFIMGNIREIVPDSWIITIQQNVWFLWGIISSKIST